MYWRFSSQSCVLFRYTTSSGSTIQSIAVMKRGPGLILTRRLLFITTLFLLLTANSLMSVDPVDAQEEGCINGTLPGSCLFLPLVAGIPPTLTIYDAIPVDGPAIDRPPHLHGDLNLTLRNYVTTTATLALVDVAGPADSDAPQLDGLFEPPRLPAFTSAYRVHDWNWNCEEHGCRGAPITSTEVSLLGMEVAPGELIHIPSRAPAIFGGDHKALVLYAEENRITLTYLREDTVAFGYAVHIENVRVNPNLLLLYQTLNASGRSALPGLRNGQPLGIAMSSTLKVAIRDRGTFMEPRSRKDWWKSY